MYIMICINLPLYYVWTDLWSTCNCTPVFSEKLREIGEKLEFESKQILASGLTEESDEESKEEESLESPSSATERSNVCDTSMDLSETDQMTEIIVSTCATNNNTSTSEEELSLEEIRAQEYQVKKAAQRLNDSSPQNFEVTEEDNCDKCTSGEEADAPRQGEENAESICSVQEGEDTKASCDSVDQSKPDSDNTDNEQEQTTSIQYDSSLNNYDSFNFWRDPLPEVSLDLEVVNDNQDEQGIVNRSSRTATENECNTINTDISSLTLTDSGNRPACATNQLYGEAGIRIHTASISTMSEESVNHIGSTHVLGQNLNEVMDGVVHGVYTWCPIYMFIR